MIIAALVVSIVAAAGSLGAVWYARRSARSAETAAVAAEKTAALDAERRHAELTPELEIACTAGENGVGDHGELRVTLIGPDGLDRLNEVTIVILDEAGANHWGHGYPSGVNEEDARRFVWGPWEFNTGASAQVTDNRTTRPRPYSPGRRPELGLPQPDTHPARPLDEYEPGTVAEAERGPGPAADYRPPRRRAVDPAARSRAPHLTTRAWPA